MSTETAMEQVLHHSAGLQRFAKATPGVFIFGSFLGSLILTNQRLLFLSAGSSGAAGVIAGELLGVFTPESLRAVSAQLSNPGGLAVPLAKLRHCGAHRRWDFGRFLRVEYDDDRDVRQATSFIYRGPRLGSNWIDEWVQTVGAANA